MGRSYDSEKLKFSLRNIAATSMIIFIGVIISKIFNYVYRMVLARYYGPEIYGVFSLALMILMLFVSISSLGLYDGILRFIPIFRGRKEYKKIAFVVRFALFISLFSGILAGLILFISSRTIAMTLFHSEELIYYLHFFSFLVPIFLFTNAFLYILRAYELVKENSIIQNIIQNLLKLVLFISFIFLGFSANDAILWSYSMGILVTLFLTYLLARYKLPQIFKKAILNNKIRQNIRMELWNYSWPIIFLGITSSLFYWIDSFSLGYFKDVVAVGLYNSAVPIAALFGITSEIFIQLFYPLITREYAQKKMKFIEEISKQVSKWIILVNLPILLIILVFPGVIINLFFGGDYITASSALRILSIGGFLSATSLIFLNLLSMAGKSKLILINILSFSILNVILNAFLVPRYGMVGAALATTLCSFLLFFVFLIQTKKYLNILPFRRKTINLFWVSLIPLIFIIILQRFITINLLTIILAGILFLVLYLLSIYFFKVFDDHDKEIFKMVKSKLSRTVAKLNSNIQE